MRDVGQKLRRLLFLVPYVAKHPEGVPVDELAQMLGVGRDHLLKDLDMLSQVGPPDGDPGEYLLVSMDNGRVFVDLPQRLTRPLRLTPAEGCSLLLGIRTLRESGVAPFDDAMESAERKLLAALGRDAGEAQELATGTVVAEPDRVVAGHLRALVTAARNRTAVEIDYVTASRHQAERRTLDPYGLVHHAGEWYVIGHCHKRGDRRTFRIDRITDLAVTGATFEIPADFDLETYRRAQIYIPSADAVEVGVHLDPLAVARVGSDWPVGEITRRDDGTAEIVIDCEGFEWVTGWVLGFGKHAWILSPPEARAAMRERVAKVAAALGGGPAAGASSRADDAGDAGESAGAPAVAESDAVPDAPAVAESDAMAESDAVAVVAESDALAVAESDAMPGANDAGATAGGEPVIAVGGETAIEGAS